MNGCGPPCYTKGVLIDVKIWTPIWRTVGRVQGLVVDQSTTQRRKNSNCSLRVVAYVRERTNGLYLMLDTMYDSRFNQQYNLPKQSGAIFLLISGTKPGIQKVAWACMADSISWCLLAEATLRENRVETNAHRECKKSFGMRKRL